MENFIENTFEKLINSNPGTLAISEKEHNLVVSGENEGKKIELKISVRIPSLFNAAYNLEQVEKNATLYCYVNGALAYGNQLAPLIFIQRYLVVVMKTIKETGITREDAFNFINS